ncbi:MAG: hypothetical protein EGR77_09930 [Pseudobutyrivibrio sp.]|nr:hypothetical protein [Pseudobutyrivibrio sp.]
MQRLRQILAILGIILLVALYLLTIIAAIFDNTNTMSYLSASIAATILIPVTLWLLNLMIQNKKKHDNEKKGL